MPVDRPLRFLVTYSGYEAYRRDFTIRAANPDLNFDTVRLIPTNKQLDEVVVMSERPPVTIKNDTIEFNANSFKTLPNALVEDLLKKLPGVRVDKDGNITVNGKPVNRMLVDGKNFFGSDPKMASRNLPANIIDKVQVVDDKEELLRSGDNNVNNVGKVVNITLKKGVKKGMFGKVYAGGGTDDRYEAGAIANIFRDTLQVSLLGYSNSLNKPGFGFSELMQSGGLERSNSNLNSRSTSIWNNSAGGSSISVNGINFGGMQGAGIATSSGVGINVNHAPNLKQSIFGQYFYGNVRVKKSVLNNLDQYNGDTVVSNNTLTTGKVLTNAHNMGLGVKLLPDSLTTFMANANYTIGLQDDDNNSRVIAGNNKLGSLSNGTIDRLNENNTYYYRHNVIYTRMSRTKKGRRLTMSHNLEYNKGNNNYTTNAYTRYVYPTPYDSALQQLRTELIPKTDLNIGVMYREPFGTHFTMVVSSRYDYGKLENQVATYNRNGDKYDVPNAALSNRFDRTNNRSSNYLAMEYRINKLTITPGIRGLWQDIRNNLQGVTSIHQNRFDFLPQLSVVYKALNVSYNKEITLPSYQNLIPVTNNTNPYYVMNGNPDLLPAEKHNVSVNYYFNNSKRNINISLYAYGSAVKNDVVQSIVVSNTGVQTTTPVNAGGSKNGSINYNINKQYKLKSNSSIGVFTGSYIGFNRNKLLYNGESSWQTTLNASFWNGLNINFNDKLEWNNSYDISFNKSTFSSGIFNTLNTNQQTLSSEVIVRVPKHLIWEANCSYDYNGNVAAGLPRTAFRLNLALNITMLKDEKGVLRLSIWDLLNRNNSVSYYTNRNTVSTTVSNVLTRYFMATFTYNIRSIGGAKKKVGGSFFNF